MAHGSKYIKEVRHPDVTRYDGEVTVQEETVDLKKKKRGKYAPYGPRLRAEIAKFAENHTNQVRFIKCKNSSLKYRNYMLSIIENYLCLRFSINLFYRRQFEILRLFIIYKYQNPPLEGFEGNT